MRSLPPLRSALPFCVRGVGALAAALILAAGGPSSAFAGTAAVTAIAVTPLDQTAPIDFWRPYTATATFSDGSTADVTASVTWSSSDPSVATISNAPESKGTATSVATGTTEISADLGGVTGSTTLRVTTDRLLSIALSPADPILATGAGRNFVAAGHLSNGADRNLTQLATWSSSDPSVATVTNGPPFKGRVTGVAVGTTEIRVQSGTIIGTTTVTVREPGASCAGGPFICKAAGMTSLSIANRPDDQSDLLRFTWTLGAATSAGDLGNPTVDTEYWVCVWDWVAGAPRLVMEMQAPPAGDCGGRPCWKPIDRGGFRYVNRSRLPDGLEQITVRRGPLGKALLRVRGRGPALPDPPMPFQQDPRITVQVVNGTVACWGTDFSLPAARNTAQKLVTREKP